MKKSSSNKLTKKSGGKKMQVPPVGSLPKSKHVSQSELEELKEPTKEDIIEKIKEVEDGIKTLREVVYWLKKTKAHKKMKCRKWNRFCEKYLTKLGTVGNINRHVNAADVERRISVPIGTLPESVTRDLYALSDTELNLAWKEAVKAHGDEGFPTAAEVKTAVVFATRLQAATAFIKNDATIAQCEEIRLVLKNRFYADKSSMKHLDSALKQELRELEEATVELASANKLSNDDNQANGNTIKRSNSGSKRSDAKIGSAT